MIGGLISAVASSAASSFVKSVGVARATSVASTLGSYGRVSGTLSDVAAGISTVQAATSSSSFDTGGSNPVQASMQSPTSSSSSAPSAPGETFGKVAAGLGVASSVASGASKHIMSAAKIVSKLP